MMKLRFPPAVVLMLAVGTTVFAQTEVPTRAEETALSQYGIQKRYLRAESIAPTATVSRPTPFPSMMTHENFREIVQRAMVILNQPIHPVFKGSIAPKSGFGVGLGGSYSWRAETWKLTGDAVGTPAHQFWALDAGLTFDKPERKINVHFLERDLRQIDFFGPGPDAQLGGNARYQQRDETVGATVTQLILNMRKLHFSAGVTEDFLRVGVSRSPQDQGRLFTTPTLPEVASQPSYLHSDAALHIAIPNPAHDPTMLTKGDLDAELFQDVLHQNSYTRLRADFREIASLGTPESVRKPSTALGSIGARVYFSSSKALNGNVVPFYMQETIGGSDTLRGYTDYRFRDRNVLLGQVEYRHPIWSIFDAVVFSDIGNVSPHWKSLWTGSYKLDYGVGVSVAFGGVEFFSIQHGFIPGGGQHTSARGASVF